MRKIIGFVILALVMAWFGRDGVRAQTKLAPSQVQGGTCRIVSPLDLNCVRATTTAPGIKCDYDPQQETWTVQLEPQLAP